MVSAIIVAAGSSRRMGFDKLFATLGGHPVLWHSIKAFQDTAEVDRIVIVAREDRMDEIEKLVAGGKFDKVSRIVSGGDERHISVWNGLQVLQEEGAEYVAIHDGARPLTTPRLIEACIALAREHGAACCASPIPDTVKRASVDHMVKESVERTGLWAMQTPQAFSTSLILQAYAQLMARHEMVTDEVSAVQKLGKKIALLKSEDWNFKITFPHDLELAEHVLELRKKKKKPKPAR
jgi:2-C-methyl-D-erythritol 4-phosphate cytidylyltransferase